MLETRDIDSPLHRATTQPRAEPDSPPPAFAGRFEVRDELGRGGMSVVYRAWDPRVEREIALKVLSRADEELAERLRREGQVAARLDHPGVLKVHDCGVAAGRPYLVYELVEGCRTLDMELASLDLPARVERVAEVADVLGHAHAAGVVHRDVKPANVLVGDDGRIRVADFGLAFVTDEARLTRSGASLGTPYCMAPEQVRGDRVEVGPPTDVWALGVLLYVALTDVLPFDGDGVAALAQEILRARPRPPRELNPEVSEALEAVCLRALSGDPRRRHADGQAFAHALRTLRDRSPRRRGRRPLLVATALGALGLLGTAAIYGLTPVAVQPSTPRTTVAAVASEAPPAPEQSSAPSPAAAARTPPPSDSDSASVVSVDDWLAEPDSAAAMQARIDLHVARGDYRRALDQANDLLDHAPNAGNFVIRASLRWRTDDREGALEDAREAARLDPAPQFQLVLGGYCVSIGEPAEGEQIARRLLTQSLKGLQRRDAYRVLGRSLRALGYPVQALAAFERSLASRASPQPGLLRDRGELLYALGRLNESERSLAHAASLRPNWPEVLRQRAEVLDLLGRRLEALSLLTRSVRLAHSTPEYRILRTYLLMRLGRSEEARKEATRVIQLQPKAWDAWVVRGKLNGRLQDWEAALADYDRSLELHPDSAYALTERAQALHRLGRKEEARRDLERALERRPGYPNALQGLRILDTQE